MHFSNKVPVFMFAYIYIICYHFGLLTVVSSFFFFNGNVSCLF
uniref:Uncharacterized protein n=1 Tax=Rhizophora mucronata TaxID=61149 RepID=A0A2P2JZP9_RHIMU